MRKKIAIITILFLLISQTGCIHILIEENKEGHYSSAAYSRDDISYADSSLLFAIGTGSSHSLEGAREAIAAGAELDSYDEAEYFVYDKPMSSDRIKLHTPVRIALNIGAREIAKELVRSGADINVEESDGLTLLMYLASWPSFGLDKPNGEEWLELLEKSGADVNYVNGEGKTALDYAAMAGNSGYWENTGTKVMEWLVSQGADVDGEMVAEALLAEDLNYFQIEYLMEECRKRGMKWEVPAECRIYYKAAFGEAESLEGIDPNQTNHEKDTLLMVSACTGNVDMMKYLIHEGADVDYVNHSTDKSALCRAIEYGRYEAAELLLEKGAEMIPDEEGGTGPAGREIGLAAAGGNTDMMNFLFARGYQLNESSLNNALRLACESGNTEAVDLLVEEAERQGLKADFYDGGKLNSAAGRHDLEMVKHLLENYHLDIGYLGMRWAVERNDVEMVELLLSYGAELNPDAAQLGDNMGYLGCAASSAGLEMVQLLVEAGAEVDGTYWNGVTPAMDAAYVSVRILKYLTEKGADINARSGYNDTPLMYAVWGKNRECVEFLLSEGADDSVVSEGQTAYEMAIERDDQESIKIFKKYGKDK